MRLLLLNGLGVDKPLSAPNKQHKGVAIMKEVKNFDLMEIKQFLTVG